jgi:hypothetical protein
MSRKNWPGALVERKTEKQMERRTAKIAMRAARESGKQNAITRGWVVGVVDVMRRGFFGRMKWLIRGV